MERLLAESTQSLNRILRRLSDDRGRAAGMCDRFGEPFGISKLRDQQ